MNVPPSAMNNSVVTQQPPLLYNTQQPFPPISQWDNNNGYNAYQLPLQLSQYYNVFPEVPSTKTSWTFPNGCVTSNIVRFTGLPTPTYPSGPITHSEQYKASGIAPVKRKSLVPDAETQPNKIFITEEKMAARMSGMHISNDFVPYNTNFQNEVNTNEMDDELDECTTENYNDNNNNSSSDNNSTPQLVVCDELKNLSKEINSLIPETLVPFEKPTTALVLWRPPPIPYLSVVKVPPEEECRPRSSVVITDITDRPDLDNNVPTVDLNSICLPSVEYPADSVEVMDM